MGLRRPPPSTLSSPLYERILQFKTLSSLRQQGTDMRRFALEFSGAAEGLGCNSLLCDTIYIYILLIRVSAPLNGIGIANNFKHSSHKHRPVIHSARSEKN